MESTCLVRNDTGIDHRVPPKRKTLNESMGESRLDSARAGYNVPERWNGHLIVPGSSNGVRQVPATLHVRWRMPSS
ncbi:unnamed protein product [Lasius platythorax]|uniref:Uncharacterized protein n=1 Tax=Lasius platythorax TaxID=488582 RepID=A0AAV2PAJ9_9HYME